VGHIGKLDIEKWLTEQVVNFFYIFTSTKNKITVSYK